jgi:O-antigen/teichoic acid export membrane protein
MNPAEVRGGPSLVATSGLPALSTIANRVATLVVLALLVRGAGTEAVGWFGLATLCASLAAAVLSAGLPVYLNREVPAGLVAPALAARLHQLRLGGFGAVALVALPVALLALPAGVGWPFWLFALASLLDQANETAWALVRGTRQAWREPVTTGLVGLLVAAACAWHADVYGGLTLGAAAGYVTAGAVARALAAAVVAGVLRALATRSSEPLPGQIRSALPYWAADVLGLLYFRGDVFILALLVTPDEVGAYVAAAALIGPAVQVAASMGSGALAHAAARLLGTRHNLPREAARDDTGSAPLASLFTATGQAVAGLALICLPVAVDLLFGPAGDTILWLAMALCLFLALRFANFGLSALLLARGGAASRLVVLVLSITGNALLNLGFAGRYGAGAAAWATVATEVIVAGSLLWFLRDQALVRPMAFCWGGAAVAMVVLVGVAHGGGAVAAATSAGVVLLVAAAVTAFAQRRAAGR